MGYLDNAGVTRLWAKCKAAFAAKSHSHSAATGSANGYMSSADKTAHDALVDRLGGFEMRCGALTATVGANATITVPVSWAAMLGTPRVIVTHKATVPSYFALSVRDDSATGCTIYVQNTTSSSRTVGIAYIAVCKA